MIDIQLVRENPEKIEQSAKAKGVMVNVQRLLTLDKQYSELSQAVQQLREERNKHTSQIKGKPTDKQLQEGRKIKEDLDAKEAELQKVQTDRQELLAQIPNPAKSDVKVGKDDSENDIIKTVGEPTKFEFTPKDHLDLGEALDIIDVKRAAKVSGARFAYLKNEGVFLEFALVQYALSVLTQEGFTPVIPPTLIKRETMQGLGYMENGGEDDMFQLKEDGLVLIATAEHALVPMHKDELLTLDQPKRYVGFSSAFRREAGSYGKDTKGILRVHQFDKVEMVSFVKQGEDDKEHEYLLSLEETLFQNLKIPYQVVKMCTGDLGFPASKKYDIEAWIPSQQKYREVTSVSTVTDFQSRRLNIKYQDGDQKNYAYVLNGTAFAIGRTIIAILENYQQEDGSVVIPEVLRSYLGKDKISKNK